VILMHAIRGDRLSMLPRARFLSAAGYSVLLSTSRHTVKVAGNTSRSGTWNRGMPERPVEFMRSQLPGERIAVIGTSLGELPVSLGWSVAC